MASKKHQPTIRHFISACWKVLCQARKQGATVEDLYEIAMDAGAPPVTFSTFSTTYYKFRQSRRVLVETTA